MMLCIYNKNCTPGGFYLESQLGNSDFSGGEGEIIWNALPKSDFPREVDDFS